MVSKKITRLVLERDAYRCVIAGPDCIGVASCPDHRAGRGSGGDPKRVLDDPANLIAACGVCNGRKEDATGPWAEDLIRRGVRVLRKGQRAEQIMTRVRATPVEYPDRLWWQLESDGSRTTYISAGGAA